MDQPRGGADLTQVGVEGQPPVALAALDRKTPVLKTLLGAGADPDTRVATPVHQRFIDAAGLRDLKSSFVNDAGLTPLMLCAIRGDVDTAVLLLQAGASTDKHTTLNRRYPINFACPYGTISTSSPTPGNSKNFLAFDGGSRTQPWEAGLPVT